MMLRSILAATAAALLVLPGSASADGVAGRVTLGQLSYTLTDLDPNDGVSPSITFLPLSASTGSPGAITLVYNAGGGWQQDLERGIGREALTGQLSGSGITMSGSATGLGDPAAWMLTAYAASAAAFGDATNIDATVQSGQEAFALSPHTALSITVTGHQTWSAAPDARPTNSLVSAWIELNVQGPLGPVSSTANPYSWQPPGPYDFTATATVSYDNNSAVSVNGSFALGADVTIIQPPNVAAPVPEPRGIDMLAAGLPLLLFGLRRRTYLDGGNP